MKKKVLTLMLAFVVMVTLCVPVTTFAGTGAMDDPAELVLDDTATTKPETNTASFGADENYYYLWTPTADGTLTITVDPSEDDWYVNVMVGKSEQHAYSSSTSEEKEFSVDVIAGSTIKIDVRSASYSEGTVEFVASFEASGAKAAVGNKNNPDTSFALEEEISVDVTGGEDDYYYKWTAPSDGKLILYISSEDWFFNINGESFYMNSYAEGEISVDVQAGDVSIYVCSDSMLPATVKFTAYFAAKGTNANPAKLILDDGTSAKPQINTAEYDGENEYCYTYTPESTGTLTLTVDGVADDWYVTVYKSKYDYESYYEEVCTDHVIEVELTEDNVAYGIKISVRTESQEAGSVAFIAQFEEFSNSGSEDDLGSLSNPETLVLNEEISVDVTGGEDDYYYKWTAPSAGTLTINIASSDWFFDINGDFYWMDSYLENVIEYEAEAEEELVIFVTTNSQNAGTVGFTATFTADDDSDADLDDDKNDDSNTDTDDDSDDNSDTVEPNHYNTWKTIKLGDNAITLETGYTDKINIYSFSPDEVGTYKITSNVESVKVTYWGYFVNDYTTDYEGNTYYYEVNCTTPQSVYIGVSGDCTLKIEKVGEADNTDDDDPANKPFTQYVNTFKPVEFTFTGDVDKLEYIDVTDDVEDKVVVDKDGYYHLNSADGPLVYVDIENPYGTLDLLEIYGNGQLRAYIFNADGSFKDKVEYGTAFAEYYDMADEGLYPLTADLKEMLYVVGTAKGWYDKDSKEQTYLFGKADVDKESAWLFKCCYLPVEDNGDDTPDTPDTPVTPVTPNTPSESKNDIVVPPGEILKINDSITFTGAPEGTKLQVSSVDANVVEKVEAFKNTTLKDTVFQMMDITLYNNAGVAVQPNGKIKITIPVMEKLKNAKVIEVFRYDDSADKLLSLGKFDVAEGTLSFETDHFSTYVFAEVKDVPTTEATTEAATEDTSKDTTTDAPTTGDKAPVMPIVAVAVIAMAVVAVVIGTKKKETNK